jgi:hypothetical protein
VAYRYMACRYMEIYRWNLSVTLPHSTKEGYFVFVRVYADPQKLTLPLAGSFQVCQVENRNGTFVVRTIEGLVRVANDRVRPARYRMTSRRG